ncbi:uncharacterized protein LOC103487388 isoform X1 [Cucumis melo]|uniref:E3 ubiquitin-protein ligase RNF12-A-like isoform X1 n=2 Tax=Cucumis melo TaxID=3656 RepID=A0A1S4DV08_CUCME|nr:uncharacterized protein LOC103487388 isoform X1 [Cucumis melo]
MGSSCSRLGSRPSRSRDYRTNRSNLCSFFCGASSSRAIHQMEDSSVQFLVHPTDHQQCNHNIDEVQLPTNGSIRMGLPNASAYSETSYENGIADSEESAVDDPRNIDINVHGKCLFQNKELAPPQQVSADYSPDESHRYSNASNGTSFKGHQSSEPVSVNILANEDAVNGIDGSVDKGVSPVCSKVTFAASSSTTQEVGNLCSSGLTGSIQEDEVSVNQGPFSESSPSGSGLPLTFQSLEDESSQEEPSSLDTLDSDNRELGQGDLGMPHVDMVGISSNVLSTSSTDTSSLEVRRNSRRLFWDAFSRRSFRRQRESPFVFPSNNFSNTGDTDRWLLDISGDFIDDEVSGDSRHFSSRIHILNEQQRNSRSQVQIWERLRSSLTETSQQNVSCPSGIHPNGPCSCDSFSRIEHSSTRASISRIIMLAEALFEVLDEIHGQPVSLALSMVSLPAPESVVDSFPLKNHEKTTNGGDEIEQCYICLAEYEEGDKIRVLPCRHEYHMLCVDKWLKEIHGVCPLCRGDVRAGSNDECSVPNNEVSTI